MRACTAVFLVAIKSPLHRLCTSVLNIYGRNLATITAPVPAAFGWYISIHTYRAPLAAVCANIHTSHGKPRVSIYIIHAYIHSYLQRLGHAEQLPQEHEDVSPLVAPLPRLRLVQEQEHVPDVVRVLQAIPCFVPSFSFRVPFTGLFRVPSFRGFRVRSFSFRVPVVRSFRVPCSVGSLVPCSVISLVPCPVRSLVPCSICSLVPCSIGSFRPCSIGSLVPSVSRLFVCSVFPCTVCSVWGGARPTHAHTKFTY